MLGEPVEPGGDIFVRSPNHFVDKSLSIDQLNLIREGLICRRGYHDRVQHSLREIHKALEKEQNRLADRYQMFQVHHKVKDMISTQIQESLDVMKTCDTLIEDAIREVQRLEEHKTEGGMPCAASK